MLTHMFPAILGTAAQHPDAWILLDTYLGALRTFFSADCVHRAIDDLPDLLSVMQSALASLNYVADIGGPEWSLARWHSLARTIELVNLLEPSVHREGIRDARSRGLDELVFDGVIESLQVL